MLTETGLDDSINSLQLFGVEFNVFRCDRSPSNSDKSRFGGVLIAVASRFTAVAVHTSNGGSLEQICVATTIRGKRLLLCVVYIPPDRSRDVGVYDSHLASVRELCDRASSDDTVLVCGDFNQPHIAWEPHADSVVNLNPSLTSTASAVLVDGVSFLGLQQNNFIRNSRGRTLDLVFCAADINITISESVSPLLAVDLHHPPLVLSLSAKGGSLSTAEDLSKSERPLNYAKIDFAALNEFLNSYSWRALVQDVNGMATRFCEIVCSWLLTNTPRKKPLISPAWSTPLLRLLRRNKNSCQRKLRRRRTAETKHNFQLASNAYRSLNASLYKSYVLRVQTNLRRNPRSFWNFVNSKRKTTDIPSKMCLGDSESSSVPETCDLFSKHFASVFVADAATSSEAERAAANVPEYPIDLRSFVVTPQMVEKSVKKLKRSTVPGPDGIPAIVFCRCASALALPLSRIYTASLDQGVFPDVWKHSFVFPVFKKGDKCNVSNYRGITSLSAASKLFEMIVNDVVFFEVKSYISPVQHGFMPGRSVSTNLLEFSSFCVNRLEERAQVDAIYTDIKAAFDRIDHRILLRKLSRLGASDGFINWMRSYLSGRTLRVKLQYHISSPFAVCSGVPQGSNLGPLLFAIFYNDVSLILASGCVSIYADDLKIYLAIRTLEDCRRLQSLLDQFVSWCQLNKLTISIAKCVIMSFHRKKQPIIFNYTIDDLILERVSQVNDLGVVLDHKLTFDAHRSALITKANRQLGFISRISRDFTDPYCLKSLYCSLVRPILETASVVWIPYQHMWSIRIERIQKCFIRRALRHLPWRDPRNLPPYVARCRLLNLDALERRRRIQQATFIVKLLCGEIDAPHLLEMVNFRAPSRILRSSYLLQPLPHRSSFGQHEPISGMIRTFSSVEQFFVFGEPSLRFKNRIVKSDAFNGVF